MKVFFTSDNHFNHSNIIKYCNRPFESVEQMNWAMVERWNTVVSPSDTVYHLGDFTLGNFDVFSQWIETLNGDINILPGNHDHRWMKHFVSEDRVKIVSPLMSLVIPDGTISQTIILCHYSMQVWDMAHFGSWHLFGHSHGTLKGIGKSFDVGVDCTDFYPLSFEQIKERMMRIE